jgi:ubiquinone/menaquinone biosynthesis C-methylase UbiE
MSQAVSGPDDGIVLDLAAGKGRITRSITPLRPVALDISERMLDVLRKNSAQTPVVLGDTAALPFRTGSADGAACAEAIVHFDDLRQVFAEVARVLKPRGTFVVSFDNSHSVNRLLRSAVKSLAWTAGKRAERAVRAKRFRPLRKSAVVGLLEDAGFAIARSEYVGVLAPVSVNDSRTISLGPLGRWDIWLSRLPRVRELATYVVLVATRV